MKLMPTMVDVMTPYPYTVEAKELVKTAVSIMYGKDIKHLPVVEHGKLVGILSDRDVKLAMAVTKNKTGESNLRVEDICILEPYVVQHNERLDTVLERMIQQHIGSALVAQGTKLVGIFTVTDACRKLSALLKIQHPDA